MYEIDKINESLAALVKKLEEYKKAAESVIGKIMPVEKCTFTSVPYIEGIESSLTSFYVKPSAERVVEEATKRLMEGFLKDETIHAKNISAIENNIAFAQNFTLMMKNTGIPDFCIEKVWNKRGTKYDWVRRSAGWVIDLQRECVTSDWFNDSVRKKEEGLKKIKEYSDKRKLEDEQKKREEEKKLLIQKSARILAQFQVKYELPPESTWSDVLEKILSKDKYLHLSHYLNANRNDWNDGPSYAEIGLEGFSVETETDKEIFDEIQALVSDWGGDGRCFRDCKWSYDAIRTLVKDEKLLIDYIEAVNNQISY